MQLLQWVLQLNFGFLSKQAYDSLNERINSTFENQKWNLLFHISITLKEFAIV